MSVITAAIDRFLSFRFAAEREPPKSRAEDLERRLCALARRRVLFVEDSEFLQNLMKQLQPSRIEVVSALTVAMAKAMIGADHYDLVILDVGLADGDGIQLYQWIKNRDQDLFHRVIFLTGGSLDDIAPKVEAIGSAPIYRKPTEDVITFMSHILHWAK